MLADNEQLKIIDFGLARKLTDNVECREMLGTPEFVGKTYDFVCLFVFVCSCLCLHIFLIFCNILCCLSIINNTHTHTQPFNGP